MFRIYGKVPVGIEARGELNIASDGNIYVAGRASGENKDTVLKMGKVTTSTGDIRVLGKAGVTNSLKDGSANLKGKDLILEGGSSDIGATDKPIDVDLTGSAFLSHFLSYFRSMFQSMTQIHSRTANGIEPCTVNTALPYLFSPE